MTVCDEHNASHGKGLCAVVFVILLFFSLTQTAAVGSVLRVNKHLHLELDSYHGLSGGLFLLLYGFNLCLEMKKDMDSGDILYNKLTYIYQCSN